MSSLDDMTENAKTLAAVGFNIVQLFNTIESSTIEDYKGIDVDEIIEQQQRFDLWATNIGLHQKGHASLDYRFRDASTIHLYCQIMLEDLAKTLETCEYQTSSYFLEKSRYVIYGH